MVALLSCSSLLLLGDRRSVTQSAGPFASTKSALIFHFLFRLFFCAPVCAGFRCLLFGRAVSIFSLEFPPSFLRREKYTKREKQEEKEETDTVVSPEFVEAFLDRRLRKQRSLWQKIQQVPDMQAVWHLQPELTPLVVEARGRLRVEVLPFVRQHAPAEEPLRSTVMARATREISIITLRGLTAFLLAAEPSPAAM